MDNTEPKQTYRVKPGTSSNIAAMVAALEAAHWPVGDFAPEGMNPCDVLMQFIMTDPVTLNRWKQLDAKGERAPFEQDEALAFGTNRFLRTFGINHSPVTFYESVTRESIVAALDSGGAAVVSRNAHAVVIAAYKKDSGFSIIDPWQEQDGSASLPLADFNAQVSPAALGKKRAHIIQTFDR